MPKITAKKLIETEQELNKKFSPIVEKMRGYFFDEMEKNNISLVDSKYCALKLADEFISYTKYFFIRLKQQEDNKK